MDTSTTKFKLRLGIFIVVGIFLFVLTIFIIGKQKNLFNPVFHLTTSFTNVSGLEVGSNIRFAGINVGTVDAIDIINDSTVTVDMMLRKSVQRFIKKDCSASIGSAGIIGDKILTISQRSSEAPAVKDGEAIASREPVETDVIISSLKVTAENAEVVSDQLAEIMIKINSGRGTLGRLIQDTVIGDDFSQTMKNIKSSSKGLDENMNAAKENFLLKGYFRRKAEAAQQLKDDEEKARKAKQKALDKAKK